MRIVRYRLPEHKGEPRWAVLQGSRLATLTDGPFVGAISPGQSGPSLEQVQLCAPALPSKVIGVGRNYAAHAAEHAAQVPREPLLFLKPPSTVIGPGEPICLPALSRQVEHEGELAVVIGRRGRHIAAEQAAKFILGYTVANDVTARDLQRADAQWTRGKGFDSFCPLGPWIETELDLNQTEVRCSVNGELRQQGRASDLVFAVPQLLAYISTVMTLEPGDVILTGTPSGVGPLAAGDSVRVEISGIGALDNPVQAEG